jgi:hypothetical protein
MASIFNDGIDLLNMLLTALSSACTWLIANNDKTIRHNVVFFDGFIMYDNC